MYIDAVKTARKKTHPKDSVVTLRKGLGWRIHRVKSIKGNSTLL